MSDHYLLSFSAIICSIHLKLPYYNESRECGYVFNKKKLPKKGSNKTISKNHRDFSRFSLFKNLINNSRQTSHCNLVDVSHNLGPIVK